jgi:hypothetical protein
MQPESYVVRVYRRGKGDPNAVVGIVEAPESHRQARFHDLAELARILGSPARHLRHAGAATRSAMRPPSTAIKESDSA